MTNIDLIKSQLEEEYNNIVHRLANNEEVSEGDVQRALTMLGHNLNDLGEAVDIEKNKILITEQKQKLSREQKQYNKLLSIAQKNEQVKKELEDTYKQLLDAAEKTWWHSIIDLRACEGKLKIIQNNIERLEANNV